MMANKHIESAIKKWIGIKNSEVRLWDGTDGCNLCEKYKRFASDGCTRCPLCKIGAGCLELGSNWRAYTTALKGQLSIYFDDTFKDLDPDRKKQIEPLIDQMIADLNRVAEMYKE